MSKVNVNAIVEALENGTISAADAKAQLASINQRKLKGVTVSGAQMDAFDRYVQSGDFRGFCATLSVGTAEGQRLLGGIVRAKYDSKVL